MNQLLWICQGVLAGVFLGVGLMKMLMTREGLAQRMGSWALDFQAPQLKLLGTVEVMGAVGIILPYATGLAPILTPLAAMGMIVILVGAIRTHLQRREYPNVVMNLVFISMAAFVVYGRL